MAHPTQTAIGTWSGGRFMHFGEPLDDERLLALLRPDDAIRTVITADVYGAGDADRMLGRALEGLPREEYVLVGAVGHDFYEGERAGREGLPPLHRPLAARPGPVRLLPAPRDGGVARALRRRRASTCCCCTTPTASATRARRCGTGWRALRDAGLTELIGVAPGPANGFTLDLIDCFERFGERIDWAMVILNPLEPWPGELALPAAAKHGVKVITRVVDYGGLFGGDLPTRPRSAARDHRAFRPAGWIEAGLERIERMRPIAERHGLTPLQLACQWNLAHAPVACVVPTLLQEAGPDARPVEEKRAELAAAARRRCS